MRRVGQGVAVVAALLGGTLAANAAVDIRAQRAKADVIAADRQHDACGNGRHAQVTLALPNEYKDRAPAAKRGGSSNVCGRIVYGSTYQVLSWLENGAVQAAVLPAFAVTVMRADDPERFTREFYNLPTSAVSSVPRFERQIVLLDENLAPVEENAEGELVDFFAKLHRAPDHKTLWLPSHLSPAVPFLLRSAARWANSQGLKSKELDAFNGQVIAAIRFGRRSDVGEPLEDGAVSYHLVDQPYDMRLVRNVPAPEGLLRVDREVAVDLSDRLVVRRRVLLASRELREVVAEVPASALEAAAEPVPLFARTMDEEKAMGRAIARFRDMNYRRVQFGATTQRHFRFTIPELWSLLRSADASDAADNAGEQPHDSRMALVLTGGGVKAAYQTSVIDFLYRKGLLVNAGDGAGDPAKSHRVDYVIGTSGGALLGVFVAALNDTFRQARAADETRSLTAVLWKEPGPGISSMEIFPFLDMMRYATLIAALAVIWVVGTFAVSFRGNFRQITRFDHTDESFLERRKRALKESGPWLILLVAAPIFIVRVASASRVEHVPVETGVYYAIMAMLAFYSDVRLNPLKPFVWRDAKFTWKPLLWFAAGLAAIAIALWRPKALQALSPFEYEGMIFVNLCCAGFVALVAGLHFFFRDQTEYFQVEPNEPIYRAFCVVLGIVITAYLGVWVAMWFEATSMLEMSLGFWTYFLLFVAIVTAVFMWLSRSRRPGEALNWRQATAGYLFSEYRSRALFGSERRYVRFLVLTVCAWAYWNALAAPALYGNGHARSYLESAFFRFTEQALPDVARQMAAQRDARLRDRRDGNAQDDMAYSVEFPLKVPFVITATSLEKAQERYFLFMSGDDEQIDAALEPEAWFEVVRDPRWVVVRKPVDRELQHAAFASGSPFPVFSAHDVHLRMLRSRGERLIDGGFAHNKPLEAAYALGADKVLVLNSSPLETLRDGRCLLGELACNIPKLVPYLWERSQVEDLLSTRRMLVASIYPTATRGPWPSLTDFRRETVRRLVEEADLDCSDRVGVIESWGAPDLRAEELIYYDRQQIITAIRESQT